MNLLIIKLGADGDVLRTLPLAKALKQQHKKAHLTWVTKGDIAQLLTGLPVLDCIKTLPYTSSEEFDIICNFDIEKEATDLAIGLKAKKKYGFFREGQYPRAFNLGAEYYLNTLFDDELKKTNRKTYQEMMFEAAEIPYHHEYVQLKIDKAGEKYAEIKLKEQNLNPEKLIGIHVGASRRWPSKVWAESRVVEFIILAKSKGYELMLFGGPDEAGRHGHLIDQLLKDNIIVGRNDPHNTKKEFAALVNACQAMVCSDSFSLHVSIALHKPTVGLFFCTSPWEVESYGLLHKVIAPRLNEFFPEKMDRYDAELTESISSNLVFKSLEKALHSVKTKDIKST